MDQLTSNLIPHKDDVIKFLQQQIDDWLAEVTPGQTERNSEIAFHCSELRKLIQKLNPLPQGEVKAPSMR